MSKIEKILARMRNNPHGWTIDTLKNAAYRYGIECSHEGTSHVVFRKNNGKMRSIPAHKPIKPVYIREFLALLED